ncbi:MAG TPA: aldehyde ferredoxin oxidoreductase family protein [Firmicutes bacterium]|nr:aldehyde ferredoxin oxidoreductase family protein [Candidatus Fermentithermobacillaceae bacterium]
MANGYWNRVLHVDLTSGKVTVDNVSTETWQTCIGGAGFGAKVLLDEVPAGEDPLGPGNVLVFALGPYQAGNNPGNAKWTVCAKSPLTNTYADSAAGAGWGMALKRAGYDALIVKGASSKPVYIVINDDDVRIKDAAELWSLDSYSTYDEVRSRENDDKYAVVSIGPAGERLVRFACIVADRHSFAGRCGLGAVMGSKKLKAIAVKGSKTAPVADPEGLKKIARDKFLEILNAAKANGFRDHGTPNLCITAETFGDMPIKYWSGDVWTEGAKTVGAPNYTQVLKAKPLPCVNCPIGCHRDIEVIDPSGKLLKGPGPEYETVGMLGSNLLVDDLSVIAKANDICNRLGIDTISAGACVGLAMECFEKGWLSESTTGLNLRWQDGEGLLKLLEQIGNREGFGEIFADGSLAAARRIHPQAEEIVAHVKGLDLPAHDARACWSLGLNYATSTRGACHMRGVTEDVEMGGFFIPELGIVKDWSKFFDWENKVELTVKLQDYCAWMNSLVICTFMVDGGELSMTSLIDMFNAITGWGWSVEDVMKSGARIFNLQRLVNIRDGHGRHTDTLPLKMKIPAKVGFRAGKAPVPLEPHLDEYYAMRGWGKNGVPTKECLQDLGLTQYAHIL